MVYDRLNRGIKIFIDLSTPDGLKIWQIQCLCIKIVRGVCGQGIWIYPFAHCTEHETLLHYFAHCYFSEAL